MPPLCTHLSINHENRLAIQHFHIVNIRGSCPPKHAARQHVVQIRVLSGHSLHITTSLTLPKVKESLRISNPIICY